MFSPLVEQNAHALVRERQLQAEADQLARRLLTVRRRQRKADKANRQVHRALLAVRSRP